MKLAFGQAENLADNLGVFTLGRLGLNKTDSGAITLLVLFIWISVNASILNLGAQQVDRDPPFSCLVSLQNIYHNHKRCPIRLRSNP